MDADGVGLAGPQLGLLRRVLVFRARDEDEITTLVNPVITSSGDESESEVEGCLSLPNVAVPVERPTSIVVDARDVEGNPLHLELNGFSARVVQHELDHLDGVLIFDRTTDEARRRPWRRCGRRPALPERGGSVAASASPAPRPGPPRPCAGSRRGPSSTSPPCSPSPTGQPAVAARPRPRPSPGGRGARRARAAAREARRSARGAAGGRGRGDGPGGLRLAGAAGAARRVPLAQPAPLAAARAGAAPRRSSGPCWPARRSSAWP